MDNPSKSSEQSLLSFCSIDDKINFNLPLKSSEIYSNAIYFGTTNIIKTNNSLTLTNNNETIFDVKDLTISIPDLETTKINDIILKSGYTEIPGSVVIDKLLLNTHTDFNIQYNNGLVINTKSVNHRFTEEQFETPKITVKDAVIENLEVQKIKNVKTDMCTSNIVCSTNLYLKNMHITENNISSSEVINISSSKIKDINTKKIVLEGSFRSFVNTIELQNDRSLKLTSDSEIYFNNHKITKNGLVVNSSNTPQDLGTFRYNPDNDNIEYLSKEGLICLNQQLTINELKEEIRVLSVKLSEIQQILTAHINALNS